MKIQFYVIQNLLQLQSVEVEGVLYDLVAEQFIGRTRWALEYLVVFTNHAPGSYWGVIYRSPATEVQESEHDDDDWLVAHPVRPVASVRWTRTA